MITKIRMHFPYQGLTIKEEISFEDYLCLIIGKNGTGKTRLLNALENLNYRLEIDSVTLEPQEIKLIDINKYHGNLLDGIGNNTLTHTASGRLMTEAIKYKSSDDLPNAIFNPRDPQNHDKLPTLNLREIIKRAEKLFNKDLTKISAQELELSLYIHNELLNGAVTGTFDESVSLSQLTINYYNAIEKNNYLSYLKQHNPDISSLDTKDLIDIIGEESPNEIFNSLLNTLFRGKFKISKPDPRNRLHEYTPTLLNENNEVVGFNFLSSGEKSIFWMISKIFAALTTSPIKIFGNVKAILLDEPDSHLHPQMIMDFYNCLKTLNDRLKLIFILTSHSPTTVALLPSNNIYSIQPINKDQNTLKDISKDGAISELLEGVSQLALYPENSRQVLVENSNDSYIYEIIYAAIRNRSDAIDNNINLSFTSAGPKLPEKEIIKHIESVFGKSENSYRLAEKLNGTGDCSKVMAQVHDLLNKGNKTIRGLIDWDCENRPHGNEIIVFAKEEAYSIENIVYDPLCLAIFLISRGKRHLNEFFPNVESWHDALHQQNELQHAVDVITQELLGHENHKNHKIHYMGGLTLLGDKEYFIPTNGNGHDFESEIKRKYGSLYELFDKSSGRPLIYSFTRKVTLGTLDWRFINRVFEDAFKKLQN